MSGKESARLAGGRGCLDGAAIVPSGGGEREKGEGRGAPGPLGRGFRLRGEGAEARGEHVGLAPSPLCTEAGPGSAGCRQPKEGVGPWAGEGAQAALWLQLSFRSGSWRAPAWEVFSEF